MGKKKRLNVNFTPEAHEDLKRLAEDSDTTITTVVQDALGLEKWVRRVISEGGRVVAEYDDGRRYELVRP